MVKNWVCWWAFFQCTFLSRAIDMHGKVWGWKAALALRKSVFFLLAHLVENLVADLLVYYNQNFDRWKQSYLQITVWELIKYISNPIKKIFSNFTHQTRQIKYQSKASQMWVKCPSKGDQMPLAFWWAFDLNFCIWFSTYIWFVVDLCLMGIWLYFDLDS